MDLAYSLLEIKSVDTPARRFSGIASTPELDRHGDSVDPSGVTFKNPVPLLFHHDTRQPIGRVTLTATKAGILFDAVLPTVEDAGVLKSRVDEAWQSIKAGVISGVSIGFRVLDGAVEFAGNVRRILRSEICEVSLVTIPANVGASILSVKALAVHKGQSMKETTADHIQNLENKRAATASRMIAIMEAAATDSATLTDDQATEHDQLEREVKTIDGDLRRFRDYEKLQIAAASPAAGSSSAAATGSRPVAVSVKSNAPKGQAFIRSVMALVASRGDSFRAMEFAKQYRDPNVDLLIKAAVAPGTTTDPAWAGALVTVNNLTNEFIELSRPATILGKIEGLTKVPFNTSVPIQTGGGTYKWVGQAKSKPVGKLTFGSTSLGMAKAAGLIVLTDELMRSSAPSAEDIVRRDMVRGIQQFLDQQFTDPAVAEVANVSPASITNGSATAASLDLPDKDLGLMITYFAGNNVPLSGLTIIMSETNAYAMGAAKNALGQQLFPGVGVGGGTANGVKVIASNVVQQLVIGLIPENILYADDGGVAIDASREATIQMNDTPVNPADPATTVWTSMFQDNLTALRAERFINWKKGTSSSVYYLTGARSPIS